MDKGERMRPEKEIFKLLEAKESEWPTGKRWTMKDVTFSRNDSGECWFRIGKVEGIGTDMLSAMINFHHNSNDPNYEPIPF